MNADYRVCAEGAALADTADSPPNAGINLRVAKTLRRACQEDVRRTKV
jgi:hypothetical protein